MEGSLPQELVFWFMSVASVTHGESI